MNLYRVVLTRFNINNITKGEDASEDDRQAKLDEIGDESEGALQDDKRGESEQGRLSGRAACGGTRCLRGRGGEL